MNDIGSIREMNYNTDTSVLLDRIDPYITLLGHWTFDLSI